METLKSFLRSPKVSFSKNAVPVTETPRALPVVERLETNSPSGPSAKSARLTKNDAKWEALQDEIHYYYIVANQTLAATMQTISEKYGFMASERKWKMKLDEWGYQKHLPDEALKILIAKADKRARDQGKNTAFILNGMMLSDSRLHNFKKRKGARKCQGASPSDPTPMGVQYFTPMSLDFMQFNDENATVEVKSRAPKKRSKYEGTSQAFGSGPPSQNSILSQCLLAEDTFIEPESAIEDRALDYGRVEEFLTGKSIDGETYLEKSITVPFPERLETYARKYWERACLSPRADAHCAICRLEILALSDTLKTALFAPDAAHKLENQLESLLEHSDDCLKTATRFYGIAAKFYGANQLLERQIRVMLANAEIHRSRYEAHDGREVLLQILFVVLRLSLLNNSTSVINMASSYNTKDFALDVAKRLNDNYDLRRGEPSAEPWRLALKDFREELRARRAPDLRCIGLTQAICIANLFERVGPFALAESAFKELLNVEALEIQQLVAVSRGYLQSICRQFLGDRVLRFFDAIDFLALRVGKDAHKEPSVLGELLTGLEWLSNLQRPRDRSEASHYRWLDYYNQIYPRLEGLISLLHVSDLTLDLGEAVDE